MVRDEKILIVQSIMATQIAVHFNNELKDSKFYKQDLKMSANNFLAILRKHTFKEFDQIIEINEATTTELFNVLYDFINQTSELGLHHIINLAEIVKAYKKDSKSINGIVNKINYNS